MSDEKLPRPTPYGWRIRETEKYWIEVLLMMNDNTRIVLVPKNDEYSYARGWCYSGHMSTPAAILACVGWSPEDGEEPTGWVKETGTERRPCGAYLRLNDDKPRHKTFVRECHDCGVPVE